MTINELVAVQQIFDASHGWVVRSRRAGPILSMARRDIVGALGELGEFANLIKKVGLIYDRRGESSAHRALRRSKAQLSEEIVDTLIYLMRLAALLNVDLENSYREKLARNKIRYRRFRTRRSKARP